MKTCQNAYQAACQCGESLCTKGQDCIKLDGVYGMYYMNPDGLSTNHKVQKERWLEEQKIFNEYKDIFPISAKQLDGYFNR